MITALLASGALKYVLGGLAFVAAIFAAWFKGKTSTTGAAVAQASAQKAVDAAQANTQAAQARADASDAAAAVVQAKLAAVEERQNVEADTSKLTPEQVKDDLDKNWSR